MQVRSGMPLAIGSAALIGLLILSGLHPYDRTTWWLEIFPILIAMPVLWASHRSFPLSPLVYLLIFAHAVVLMVGGAYTYARVPLGFFIENLLHLSRNPYDKIGHFMQGFAPAMIAREIFIRRAVVSGRRMLAFLCICVVMFISSTYELVEWISALALGQGADEFLGTQGDPWDTQSDMAFALIGGTTALLLLSRLHDRQLGAMPSRA